MNLQTVETARYLNVDAKLENPNLWWNTISNFQKAIRRCDVDHALFSATLLYHTDPIKLLRRMSVIALEDVGFGSLKLVAKTLDYTTSHKSVAELTENAYTLVETLSLVGELAQSVKDRSPCQLAVASKWNLDGVERVALLSPEKCAALFADEQEDMQLRCLAGRSLTGNLTRNNLRIGKADRKAFLGAISKMDLPGRILAIAEKGAGLGGEPAGLAVSIPILYPLMKAETKKVCWNRLPDAELIRGLLSPSYDMHNHEGKWSMSAFAATCEPLRQFSKQFRLEAKKIIGDIVFMGEGSVVKINVGCTLTDALYAANEQAQCFSVGLPYEALAEGKQILLDNLASLNGHRRRIAEATSYFDTHNVNEFQGTLI